MSKPIIFSGIQPSGDLHIGAYFGALKNWVKLQDDYKNYFCIVDMHAITVPQDPKELYRHTLDMAKLYIACGIDPEKSTIYAQSSVSAHAELAWVLNCFTYLGELEKMTQYKEKSAKHKQRASAGLFNYPVLMAADILLYQTNLVPVGEDQTQHVELARDIAKRVNNKYDAKIFEIPELFVPKQGARIKGLQEPEKKMSKSTENQNDAIFLLDPPDLIKKKISKAVTDAGDEIKFDPAEKPGISNLLTILAVLRDTTTGDLEHELNGMQYGAFKSLVAKELAQHLEPIQERYNEMSDDDTITLLADHANRANSVARKTLAEMYKKIGFLV